MISVGTEKCAAIYDGSGGTLQYSSKKYSFNSNDYFIWLVAVVVGAISLACFKWLSRVGSVFEANSFT